MTPRSAVFRARTDGYRTWSDFAQSLGRGSEWHAWSEDEACTQRNVVQDTEASAAATPYCEL